MSGVRAHQLTLESVKRRDLTLALWLPGQDLGASGARPRVLAKMSGGHLTGLSGVGSRLSAPDQLLAKTYLESRRSGLNAAIDELLTRALPRGKLGRLPVRLRRLTVFERDRVPYLSGRAQAVIELWPTSSGGPETSKLLLPTGSDELLLLSFTDAWWQEWQKIQVNGAVTLKSASWTWDPHLREPNVHLMAKTPISKARPFLGRSAKGDRSWTARTPSGGSMSDAFIAECEQLGPALRRSIALIASALA